MLRAPAVAGQFYPGTHAQLAGQVAAFLETQVEPQPALVAVSPHAGYVYSGAVAGKVFSRVVVPPKVVLLGPNHRGLGAPVALMSQGAWQTPLGEVPLDAELGGELLEQSRLVREDHVAHQYEHSLEVQVPFLQARQPDLRLTPLCLSGLSLEQCQELGRDLAAVIQRAGEPVLMVASTDMTHYESAEQARDKDSRAIERIQALDPQGLYQTVLGQGISMCGVIPTTVCLAAALRLGAGQAELVAYTNSGEATGDMEQVVGYAGLIIR